MGKLLSKSIKSKAETLLELYKEKFNTDFENNKRKVEELTDVRSRMMRNRIAGYVTRYRQVFLQAK